MIDAVITFLQSLISTYGVPGLFVVMFAQAVVAPLPSDIFPVLAVMLGMHPITVVLVASLGSTAGGVVDFYLVKKGAKPYLERLMRKSNIEKVERWFDRWGAYALVLGRAVPFMSSDALAYVAGISNMSLKVFVPLAFLGILLRCIILITIGTAIQFFIL